METGESLHRNKNVFTPTDQMESQQASAVFLSKPLVNICKAPLARITILFQVQGMYSNFGELGKPSILREISRIVSEEGFRSLWKGNLVSIARRPPCLALDVLISYILNTYLQPAFGLDYPEKTKNARKEIVFVMSAMISNAIATSAVYPMDLVRTRLAAQRSKIYYDGIRHAFSTIYREEGFLGLFKGNGASILRKAPKVAISLTSYELIKSSWESQRPNDSVCFAMIASAGISGVLSTTATFPMDVVKRRLQLDGAGGKARVYNTGLYGIFKYIIKKEGLRGLYRGILPDFLKVFPRVVFYFMTYEMMKRHDWYTPIPDTK